jgi:NAD+ synthase (glutamine-hydrolysing)
MIKSAIAAINLTIQAWSEQKSLIQKAIYEAKEAQVELLVFPELVIGGPDAQDLYLRSDTYEKSEAILAEIASMTFGMTVVLGAPVNHKGKYYNTAAVFHDGCLKALVPKRYANHHADEHRYFEAWDFSQPHELHAGASFGALNVEIPGFEKLCIILGDPSVHPIPEPGSICVEIAARPYAYDEFTFTLQDRIELSKACQITWLAANLLGSDDGTHVYDGGGYILHQGHILALAPRFVFDRDVVVTTSEDKPCAGFDPTLAHIKSAQQLKTAEDHVQLELELALCLALHDYTRRSGIRKLCLALSGGRDSAMVAMIAARLIQYLYPDADEETQREKVREFLLTAYLPSQASSTSATQEAAVKLAEHYGFDCHIIPIADLAHQTLQTVETTLGRQLTWETDDLTLQNVQARMRSSIIWTLANAHHAMLLTTGNQSEAAVGYTTMDGDSSGCLDPIGNIPKTLVSQWLEWARNYYNIPALDLVFAQPPSAELRPSQTHQADEKDLMPYPLLDALITWYCFERRPADALFELAKAKCHAFCPDDDLLIKYIQKFLTMLPRAQWKRLRLANSFMVLPHNLSADQGYRMPCLMTPDKLS